jgi:hypothetical protein
MSSIVTANGQSIEAKLPCTIEEFLVAQGLLSCSVVVEHALARAPGRR